ncbi:hypothetical protein GWI33_011969 [Rhynchophorus ferrugineus]|uniref:Uncharacterized protein n=1 Tax=Rhynchophorus ferrugineus TaxID=354439 RepID=A0A834MIL6_RHYFE|nr:hypothetical protein GWI33_011969 [Rhynchophorus ferrugineus]
MSTNSTVLNHVSSPLIRFPHLVWQPFHIVRRSFGSIKTANYTETRIELLSEKIPGERLSYADGKQHPLEFSTGHRTCFSYLGKAVVLGLDTRSCSSPPRHRKRFRKIMGLILDGVALINAKERKARRYDTAAIVTAGIIGGGFVKTIDVLMLTVGFLRFRGRPFGIRFF